MGAGDGLRFLAPASVQGSSGGVAEFVFRAAAAELFGVRLSSADVGSMWTDGRNEVLACARVAGGRAGRLRARDGCACAFVPIRDPPTHTP